MVPYLIDNPSIGFVQARWTFTNPEESYLTKAGAHQTVRFSMLQHSALACYRPRRALQTTASGLHLYC